MKDIETLAEVHEALQSMGYRSLLRPGSVAVSSLTGAGTDDLLRTLGDRLRTLTEVVELLIPYDRGDLVAAAHREGEVLD